MPGQPLVGENVANYRIESHGEILGYLVELKFEGDPVVAKYLVQNSFHQQIGFIDRNGRAFRYRVSDGGLEHLATGTMAENLKAFWGLSDPPKIISQ